MADQKQNRVAARLVRQLEELKAGERDCVWVDAQRDRTPEEAEQMLRAAMKTAKVSVKQFPIQHGRVPVKPKWTTPYAYIASAALLKAAKEAATQGSKQVGKKRLANAKAA